MMRQPQERAKILNERRAITFEKHAVEKINPINGFTEIEIHQELDRQGQGVKESMLANQEREAINTKLKRAAQAPQREKVLKERIKKLEERDKKNGKLLAGKKFMAEQASKKKGNK